MRNHVIGFTIVGRLHKEFYPSPTITTITLHTINRKGDYTIVIAIHIEAELARLSEMVILLGGMAKDKEFGPFTGSDLR